MGSRSARVWRRRWLLLVCLLSLTGAGVMAALSLASPATAQHPRRMVGLHRVASAPRGWNWIATWGAAPQAPTAGNPYAGGFADQTVRNVVFSSAGGSMVRVRFTNVFGAARLDIGRAAIGLARDAGAIAARTDVPLSFGGRASVVIPPGGEVVSDPAPLAIKGLQDLAVSVFLPRGTGPPTEHAMAKQAGYVAAGDHALDGGGSAFTAHDTSWYFIDSVDVLSRAADAGTIVALGDSITDGVGSSDGANARWPNDLARRLDGRGQAIAVADEGIGGNRVLSDPPCCGVSAQARFLRDVVERSGARVVILLEGINDIGQARSKGSLTAPHTDVSAAQIIAGDEQIIRQAHAAGLQIIGATLTPFAGARHWSPAGAIKRDEVNHWILASGAFDGVIDFAKVLADPADPQRLDPAYDSGDHLHPNDAGYRAMAGSISLAMLRARERRAAAAAR